LAHHPQDNFRASLLMVASMAIFAVEDLYLKWSATDLPPGQVIAMMGAAGAVIFGLMAEMQGNRVISGRFLSGAVVIRNLSEAGASLLWIVALAAIPLSLNSAILQAMPLAVTLGAVVFMGEKVGWRRWTAILVGFAGVLIILRPGTGGFEPLALLTVASVVVLAARDLATRVVPGDISTLQLTTWAYVTLVPAGLLLMVLMGDGAVMPVGGQWFGLAMALVCGILGYYGVTLAMRMGEVSAIAPYRYSRLVFSLVIAAVFLGEHPDIWMIVGAALVVGSGLYTFAREARLRRQGRAA
jgi:drug/metabolite transporter (DMT)-like permease